MEPIDKENVRHIYNKYAAEFNDKIAGLNLYNETYDHLLEQLGSEASVLDLACGPGNVSAYLKNKKENLSITGVDVAQKMVEIAGKRIPDASFFVGNICHLDLSERFDCVVCAFAIPFLGVKEIDQLVDVIARHLKKSGVFYLSFIKGNDVGYEKTSFSGADELYLAKYSREEIVRYMSAKNLKVLKTFEIDYPEKNGTIATEIVFIG